MNAMLVQLREVPRHRRLDLPRVITPKTAKSFNAKLRKFCRSPRPIIIIFDSDGGETEACLSIYDNIQSCVSERIFGVVKRAFSGSLIALQACGIRAGRPRSKYMAHSPRRLSGLEISAYMDIDEWLAHARKEAETGELILRKLWEKKGHDILLEKVQQAGKTNDDLIHLFREERIMGADEALQWNFIDVVRKRQSKPPSL